MNNEYQVQWNDATEKQIELLQELIQLYRERVKTLEEKVKRLGVAWDRINNMSGNTLPNKRDK